MHLDLLQSISLCGDAATPNDDRAGADATRAWVIDGATDLGPPGLLGDRGGAAWLAAAADSAFGQIDGHAADRADGGDLRATCGQVFAAVEQRFVHERRRDPVAAWELPSAAFAAVQLTGNQLDVAWAADCAVLLMSRGAATWCTPVPDRRPESAAAAALGDGVGASTLRSPAVLDDRRRARERVDRRVLTVDATVSRRSTDIVTMPVSDGDSVLLMSDGFVALVDSYAAYDAAGLFAAVIERGLASLAVELRTIEQGDAACRRYPRFKRSDDATALWLRVAGTPTASPA